MRIGLACCAIASSAVPTASVSMKAIMEETSKFFLIVTSLVNLNGARGATMAGPESACSHFSNNRRPTAHGPASTELSSAMAAWCLCRPTIRVAHQCACDSNNSISPSHRCNHNLCLLYTSDAADDLLCVDLGG